MPLPPVLRLSPRSERILPLAPLHSWKRVNFEAHIEAMPLGDYDRRVLNEMLRRIR